MLARYRIQRGKRAPDDPLPDGVRQDTRKHTRHCLRPDAAAVERYLASPGHDGWDSFAAAYRELIEQRFAQDRAPFEDLAQLAGSEDVYLGCSCPTAKNPDVRHCHTWLALEFMRDHYPDLAVEFPQA